MCTMARTSTGSAANAVSKWLLTGTTLDGEQVRVRGCDLLDLDPDGRIRRKDAYWKLVT
jgi:hypothetical protein